MVFLHLCLGFIKFYKLIEIKMTRSSGNKSYNDEGYVAPINVLSTDEAKEVRDEIEYLEKNGPMN